MALFSAIITIFFNESIHLGFGYFIYTGRKLPDFSRQLKQDIIYLFFYMTMCRYACSHIFLYIALWKA